jgi:FixJ family two-component response regulator
LHAGIRVLFMSGYTDPLITYASALSADSSYLQKPFEKDALARAVRDALG